MFDIFDIVQLLLGIILAGLSLYFGILSRIVRERNTILIHYALMNLILSFRSFIRVDFLTRAVLDTHEIWRKVDHFTYFIGFYVFVSFFREIFREKFPDNVRKITLLVSLFYTGLLFVPGKFYLGFREYFHIYSLVVALYLLGFYAVNFLRKEKYAVLRFLGFLSVFLGFGTDILLVEAWGIEPVVTSFGMIFYSIAYSLFVNFQLEEEKHELIRYQEQLQKKQEELEKNIAVIQEQESSLRKLNFLYESLLDLAEKIASTSDFHRILGEIAYHLETNFRIKYFVIMTIDPEKGEAQFFNSNLFEKLDAEQFDTMRRGEGKMNLDLKVKGVHSGVYKHKKPLYLKHFSVSSKKSAYDLENFLQEKLGLKSLIVFPLVYNNEVFGFFDLTNVDEPLKLSGEEYLNLKVFVQYFSQLFRNYLFMQEIQKQREVLALYNREVAYKNKIILVMNEFISRMYVSKDVDAIFEIMMDFLKKHFHISYYLFYRYNPESKALEYVRSNLENEKNKEMFFVIKNNRIPLTDEDAIHYVVCKKRRFVYLPNVRESPNLAEAQNQQILGLKNLLIFPLYFGEELIGTLDFSHEEEILLDRVKISLIKIFVNQTASILKNRFLIDELENKKKLLEESYAELQFKKLELEKLNELTRKINSSQDFQSIIQDVFIFFENSFGLGFSWLLIVDEKNNVFRSSAFSRSFADFPEDVKEFLLNFNAPLSEEAGTIYRTYKKKKYFYVPKIYESFKGTKWDHDILNTLKLSWFLHMPLVVQDKVTGILAFTNYQKKISLRIEDLNTIQYFCDQIAGALYNSYLLEQIRQEKQKADIARKELQQLNAFTRQIIEKENFEELIQNIFYYLRERYGLQFGWLLLIDKEKKRIRTSSFTKDIPVSEEMHRFLQDFDEPYTPELGTIYRSCERKKHLYLKRIGKNLRISPVDEKLIRITNLQWVLYVPLVLKGETVGLLAFTNYERTVYLQHAEIQSILAFCNQIAGAIYNSYLRENLAKEKEKTEKLLLNILPAKVAEELKENGFVRPRLFKNATIMFTDFVNFTGVSTKIPPEELIQELDRYFHQFDEVISRFHLTKLKTIGDAYMCVGGIPEENHTHAVDTCLAALEIRNLIKQTNEIREKLGLISWGIRIGINTGEVIAGVVGKERFAYDVWGDAVNIAQRMESASEPYEINISRNTYELVKYFFRCEYRGKKYVKNRGYVEMFFLKGIHARLSRDGDGKTPNEKFLELYRKLQNGARIAFRHEVKKIFFQ